MSQKSEQEITKEVAADARHKMQQQSPLEQTLSVGVNGAPELRRGERSIFLGQFPEQVLKAATAQAIAGKTVPDQLQSALADPRCRHVYLSAACLAAAGPILHIIRQRGLRFTVVQSPDHQAGTAVVLTTDQPHDQVEIWVGKP